MRIAMWSGPRNLSTAMMYSFAARADCAVIDEPFYAAYLIATGLKHPMQKDILGAQPHRPEEVIAQCLGDIPNGKKLFYQKHMTHHMVDGFPLDWFHSVTHVFLIRHPARVIHSYRQKREKPSLEDIGFKRQYELFELIKNQTGTPPIVVDSDDILSAPEPMLKVLCASIGIDYQSQMLSWPSGGNAADGVWAPHWYASVWKSTGLTASPPKPLPDLSDDNDMTSLIEQALPFYLAMKQSKLILG
jgi:hypothetical protein